MILLSCLFTGLIFFIAELLNLFFVLLCMKFPYKYSEIFGFTYYKIDSQVEYLALLNMKFVLCILFFAAFCARSYCKYILNFNSNKFILFSIEWFRQKWATFLRNTVPEKLLQYNQWYWNQTNISKWRCWWWFFQYCNSQSR